MQLFRKVLTKDRLPEPYENVYVNWGDEFGCAHTTENGYWWMAIEGIDCDEPEWWLEQVNPPTDKEINQLADDNTIYGLEELGYFNGFKAALKYMEGKNE